MVHIPSWPSVPIWQIPRKVNLDSTLAMLKALGNPQNKLPPVIHVAGTNGKGSTVAMLRSIFGRAGYKVDSYTSPHLIEFNERINLNGELISDYHLNDILLETKDASDKLGITPTFFEGTTVAAFLAFSRSDADILILETGLGGRLDCTNVIEKPLVTIITSISMDHTEFLGEDILKIAAEKAGIIKEEIPCVIGPQTDEVYDLLFNKCEEKSAPTLAYQFDYGIEKHEHGFNYKSKDINLDMPMPSLPGDHQMLNASSVIAAISLINKQFKLTKNQIADGIANTFWPGRLQKIDEEKTIRLVGEGFDIYADGAHNESGAIALSNWLKSNAEGDVYMVIGMTRGRDVQKFCKHFKGLVNTAYAVTVESEPSSYKANKFADLAEGSGVNFIASDNLEEALLQISKLGLKNKSIIIVTGSLFLISDLLKL